jgi:pimeloyl-ACP methyl ester carboxylesterase
MGTLPLVQMRWGDLTGAREPSDGSGRAVLFVHGWWGGAWVWERYLRRFAERGHDGHALNLTGYHGSGATRAMGTVPFAQHLGDVLAVVQTLDRPVLVGHSVGGLLAAKAASLADVAGCVVLAGLPPRGTFSATTTRVMLPYLPQMLRGRPLLPSEPAMGRMDLNRLPPDEQAATYRRMAPAPGRQGLEIGILGVPVRGRDVRCPVLSIGGSDDALTPPRVARAIGRRLGGTSQIYDGHAHYLIREPGWEVIADDVLAWIERLA